MYTERDNSKHSLRNTEASCLVTCLTVPHYVASKKSAGLTYISERIPVGSTRSFVVDVGVVCIAALPSPPILPLCIYIVHACIHTTYTCINTYMYTYISTYIHAQSASICASPRFEVYTSQCHSWFMSSLSSLRTRQRIKELATGLTGGCCISYLFRS